MIGDTMSDHQRTALAKRFIFHAIQDWGQTDDERIAAVQAVLDAAGFAATATCGPVFGGIWPKPCGGLDGEAATAWLKNLTANLRRGDFHDEVRQIEERIRLGKNKADDPQIAEALKCADRMLAFQNQSIR